MLSYWEWEGEPELGFQEATVRGTFYKEVGKCATVGEDKTYEV